MRSATPRRHRRPTGYTLIEVLLVVVILSILATMVIPKFADASREAREAAMKSTLKQVQAAIDRYKAHHDGQLPDLISGWDALTTQHSYNGIDRGPYLVGVPVNPIADVSVRSAVADGDPAMGSMMPAGFVYDYGGGAGSGAFAPLAADGISPLP
ncbi:MAG TPA: type II secretion system protein [Tepidisphaeraceae bacterium]|nr:type II secretion system protein [Tepidisphaeraceae bacterium]